MQGVGNIVNAGDGITTVYGGAAFDTFVLPHAFKGFDTITGSHQYNVDKLDVRGALSSTAWDGNASTLGNYLKVTDSGGSTEIAVVTPQGGCPRSPLFETAAISRLLF